MNTAIVEVDRPWLAMSSMLIGAFVGMLSETSLNIALPTLGRVFSIGTGTLQWLVTGYMLMIGIVLPFSSLISKWFSTRQIIIFALADFTVGALISGFANSFGMLLFGRMIQGIGTGLILPLMFTVAMLIFPPKKLGLAMGINALVIMFHRQSDRPSRASSSEPSHGVPSSSCLQSFYLSDFFLPSSV